jgi:hypothetical protein
MCYATVGRRLARFERCCIVLLLTLIAWGCRSQTPDRPVATPAAPIRATHGQPMDVRAEPQAAATDAANAQPGVPVAALYLKTSGNLMRPHGLLVVAWEDGTVVFANDPSQPGKDLRKCRLDPEAVRAAVNKCDESGLFDFPSRVSIAVDSHYLGIRVRAGDRVAWQLWTYPFPEDRDWYASTYAEGKAFLEAIDKSEAALLRLRTAAAAAFDAPRHIDSSVNHFISDGEWKEFK